MLLYKKEKEEKIFPLFFMQKIYFFALFLYTITIRKVFRNIIKEI